MFRQNLNSPQISSDLLSLRRKTPIHQLLEKTSDLDCVKEIIKCKDQQARDDFYLKRAIENSMRFKKSENIDEKWRVKKCQMICDRDRKNKIIMRVQ